MAEIILILSDVRSAQNVGAILRSADAFGVKKVYLAGITPYPAIINDPRLPHIAIRATKQIAKTALGAEESVPTKHIDNIGVLIQALKKSGYLILALEQAQNSISLSSFQAESKMALIVGNEITGLPSDILNKTDIILEIPMLGQKESLNVSVATGIALYALVK